MTTNDRAEDASAAERPASWRELAVARSLDPARVRAEKRVQRFLDAALELMNSDSGREFTVQEVVERSNQSLRSFYQYFAGKHELLLALFEESVRSTSEHLQEVVAGEKDPLDRLRRFTFEYYKMCRPVPRGKPSKKAAPTPALVEFAQQLLTDHPKEASLAYVPLVALLEQLLDEAAGAGEVRAGLDHHRIAGVVLQAISFNAFSAIISGTSLRPGGDDADELWGLLIQGIGA
jgi:AcrR family transcriptional regulator